MRQAILEQFEAAYGIHRWLRYLTWLGIAGAAILLLWVSDGFPPRAWYRLAQLAPQVRDLWIVRGPAMLLPLLAVMVLSLTWLVLWCSLLCVSLALGWRAWQERQQLRKPRNTQPGKTGWMPSRRSKMSRPARQHHEQAHAATAISGYAKSEEPVTSPAVTRKIEAPPIASTDIGVGWDAGLTRRHRPNEDGLLVLRGTCTYNTRLLPVNLFVVADGMGGHADGRVASHLAIQSMMQTVLPAIQNSEELSSEFFIDTLVDCTHQANQAVYEYKEERGIDLGTTITAALLVDSTAYIVNVGDSRTYLYRQGRGLKQLTHDHSLVARLVAVGAISPEEVYTHPDRNQVYRGLGDKGTVQVDWFTQPVKEGDFLLLCSDGLWEMVRDQEIERILERCVPDPVQASAALVKAALHRGGADNISVIVVRC